MISPIPEKFGQNKLNRLREKKNTKATSSRKEAVSKSSSAFSVSEPHNFANFLPLPLDASKELDRMRLEASQREGLHPTPNSGAIEDKGRADSSSENMFSYSIKYYAYKSLLTFIAGRLLTELDYSDLFSKYGHSGKVRMDLELPPDGVLNLRNIKKINGDNSVLKIYCLRGILRALTVKYHGTENTRRAEPLKLKLTINFINVEGRNSRNYAIAGDHLFVNLINGQKKTLGSLSKNMANSSGFHMGNGMIFFNPFELPMAIKDHFDKNADRIEVIDPFEAYRKDPLYEKDLQNEEQVSPQVEI